jgi:hypothetical protein
MLQDICTISTIESALVETNINDDASMHVWLSRDRCLSSCHHLVVHTIGDLLVCSAYQPGRRIMHFPMVSSHEYRGYSLRTELHRGL